ncbi:hypothetical protein [Roseivivax sp. CAU 1761]
MTLTDHSFSRAPKRRTGMPDSAPSMVAATFLLLGTLALAWSAPEPPRASELDWHGNSASRHRAP